MPDASKSRRLLPPIFPVSNFSPLLRHHQFTSPVPKFSSPAVLRWLAPFSPEIAPSFLHHNSRHYVFDRRLFPPVSLSLLPDVSCVEAEVLRLVAKGIGDWNLVIITVNNTYKTPSVYFKKCMECVLLCADLSYHRRTASTVISYQIVSFRRVLRSHISSSGALFFLRRL